MPDSHPLDDAIDLRSDTVTRPSSAMYDALAQAPLGDDVYGGDPTVHQLEETVADLLGFEAAVFVTSGTQSNLSALLAHCGRGDEYIAGEAYHIYRYEGGGAAALGGIAPHPVPVRPDGALDPEVVLGAIRPIDDHFARTRLLSLENTHNGKVLGLEYMQTLAGQVRERGLAVHLDGARLMNAAVALGEDPADLVGGADSVSLCLSKGLGAPVGSVLAGSRDFVTEARHWRKMLGGGLRQSGVLAACGLVALNRNVERLAEDHENARSLAERLQAFEGLTIDMANVQTNMVYVALPEAERLKLVDFMAARGILLSGVPGLLRLVTHLDVSRAGLDRVIAAFGDFYKR